MKIILSWLLLVTVLIYTSEAEVKVHQCCPIGINAICILEYVFYRQHDNDTHVFPKNYTHILINDRIRWTGGVTAQVWRFDSKLHAEMGQPPIAEVAGVAMEELEIPRKLQYGGFCNNDLSWFSVQDGETEPALSYLDLAGNHFENLTNITSLVNLQTLMLSRNAITSLDSGILTKLPKLKLLDLAYNLLHHLSAREYPPSLADLHLFGNKIKTLNYSDIYFGNMKRLNLEHNGLEQIDASAVLLAMPKLELFLLGGNHFSLAQIKPLEDIFRRHNVSVAMGAGEYSCRHDAIELDGICIRRNYVKWSWLKATGFSILTILVAATYVLLVRWVFIAMNK